MKRIVFDMDKNEYKFEGKLLSFNSHCLLEEFVDNIEELSGFMIIVNDKILLVKPRKFKGMEHKWSIPKGKLDGRKKFKNALQELKEETGIVLDKSVKNKTEEINLYYKKSGQMKKLTSFVIELNPEDLNVDLNHKWEVEKDILNKKEIYKAKFFTKEEAMDKIETGQMPLLKII